MYFLRKILRVQTNNEFAVEVVEVDLSSSSSFNHYMAKG